jgi:hypothetical protein
MQRSSEVEVAAPPRARRHIRPHVREHDATESRVAPPQHTSSAGASTTPRHSPLSPPLAQQGRQEAAALRGE